MMKKSMVIEKCETEKGDNQDFSDGRSKLWQQMFFWGLKLVMLEKGG